MGRKRKHEEHINHEAWAIPYADLLVLLLAFFVVMYAISSVNLGKYRVLADSLVTAFRSAPKSMVSIEAGTPAMAAQVPQLPKPQEPRSLAPFNTQRVPSKTPARESGNQPFIEQVHAGTQDLPRIAEQIEQAMAPLIKQQLVAVRRDDQRRWLEVEIKASILFGSGSARLEREALPVLERLGAIMSQFANPIEVRGHTDNKPINTPVFPSNWELSAMRAASVVHLLAGSGVAPERLSAVGYGEHRPLADNGTELGRSQNRRVSLLILADEAVRRSLQDAHPELVQPASGQETEPLAAPVQRDAPPVVTAVSETMPQVTPPAQAQPVARNNEVSTPVPPAAIIPQPPAANNSAPSVIAAPESAAAPATDRSWRQVDNTTTPGAPDFPAPEVIHQTPVQAREPARQVHAPPPARRMIQAIAPPIQLAPPVQMRLPVPQAGTAPVHDTRARQQEAH